MEEFAKFLVDYKKAAGDNEEDDDVDANELDILFDSTGREECNGLAPGTIMGNFTRLKSCLFSKFKPLGFQNDIQIGTPVSSESVSLAVVPFFLRRLSG